MRIHNFSQAARLVLFIFMVPALCPYTRAQNYQVGVPVCDTIGVGRADHAELGGCDPYDYLWFRLLPSLDPYVTGLSFQLVITATTGRIWSSLTDTVKTGDVLPISAPTDSGVRVYLATSSSFEFLTSIVGTPTVVNESYYCEVSQARTARVCENSWQYFGEGPICQIQPAAAVEEDGTSNPTRFQLLQNYPNPFNPETTIGYTLPKPNFVKLRIFDMLGQEVRALVNGFQEEGFKAVVWDGKNNNGQFVPSGQYIYQLNADGFTRSVKSLLLK